MREWESFLNNKMCDGTLHNKNQIKRVILDLDRIQNLRFEDCIFKSWKIIWVLTMYSVQFQFTVQTNNAYINNNKEKIDEFHSRAFLIMYCMVLRLTTISERKKKSATLLIWLLLLLISSKKRKHFYTSIGGGENF